MAQYEFDQDDFTELLALNGFTRTNGATANTFIKDYSCRNGILKVRVSIFDEVDGQKAAEVRLFKEHTMLSMKEFKTYYGAKNHLVRETYYRGCATPFVRIRN